MKSCEWFEKTNRDTIKCTLCPHECTIREGKLGSCHVRMNREGILYPENYGMVSALHLDPIEKKPLYHFYPGSQIFSVGSAGCNLRCHFCQNCEISQVTSVQDVMGLKQYTPQQIVESATTKPDNIGIAYTYNEPTVWYEFMMDTAKLAKEKGLRNVMVTNGFINLKPLMDLLEVMDAFSVDIKGFTGDFYHKVTAAALEPVKEAIKLISSSGKHFELVNLVIPGMNDNRDVFEEMVKWIYGELGKSTVLHLSRYFPMYKLNIEATPPALLEELHETASRYLDFVYLGNISSNHGNTHCPKCSSLAIVRKGYNIYPSGIDESGYCKNCNTRLITHMHNNQMD